jgi:hypothetical protein
VPVLGLQDIPSTRAERESLRQDGRLSRHLYCVIAGPKQREAAAISFTQRTMSLPLRPILPHGSLRRLRCTVHTRAARSISSSAGLKDAPRPPTLEPEIDIPNAEKNDGDSYEPFRTQESPRLLRPILFALRISICAFAAAAHLTNQEFQENLRTATTTGLLVIDRHERTMRELRNAYAAYTWLREKGWPAFVLRSYARLGDYWLNTRDGERVALGFGGREHGCVSGLADSSAGGAYLHG